MYNFYTNKYFGETMKFITNLTILIFSLNIFALENVHNALSIYTDKPISTIGQIKAMFEGPLGKYMGKQVYVYQNLIDGNDPATHLIINEYEDYDAYQKAIDATTGKDPEAGFWWYVTLNELSFKPIMNGQDLILASNNRENWEKNIYFMAIGLNVSDSKRYKDAWVKMSEKTKNFIPNGSSWLSQSYGGSSPVTHNVLLGANSYSDLMEGLNKIYASEAFEEFVKEARPVSKVISRVSSKRIATFNKKN
ncbi:MAG: hypothetical protein CMD68_01295 [Gammaproteobacteria bacterium]|nr:hypothetical protein [Gammaproteobacteria bacterium]